MKGKIFLVVLAFVFAFSLIGVVGVSRVDAVTAVLPSDDYDYNYYDDYDYDDDYDYGYDDDYGSDVFSGLMFWSIMSCMCCIWAVWYIYMSVSLMKLAEKTGHGDKKIFAWIPYINLYLMTLMAKKEAWWLLLMFVPFANVIVSIILWMEIAKNVKHPEWVGVLMVVPFVNFFVPGYLAFVDGNEK